MKKTLIVIDMQNDFITGSLANPAAEKLVQPMIDYIKAFDGQVVCTQDTHGSDYLKTSEGKYLPVEHCILNTWGWMLQQDIAKTVAEKNTFKAITKPTFGYLHWGYEVPVAEADELYICGVVSSICVISNALILKALFPNKKIAVIKNLCAGLSEEDHDAAMKVLQCCQVEVIE